MWILGLKGLKQNVEDTEQYPQHKTEPPTPRKYPIM